MEPLYPVMIGARMPYNILLLRRRLYDHITPAGYLAPISRFFSAALDSRPVNTIYPKISSSGDAYRSVTNAKSLRDDLWAEYLLIPRNERHNVIWPKDYQGSTGKLSESQYKPTKGATEDKYYKLQLGQSDIGRLVRKTKDLQINLNINSRILGSFLGAHTVGRGYDKKGEYVSYYDKWDLAPFGFVGPDQSLGIGKPISIYDRIYLDDYYGAPLLTHSTWLPEIEVYPKGSKKPKLFRKKETPWYVEN